jgi:hypothetical protein
MPPLTRNTSQARQETDSMERNLTEQDRIGQGQRFEGQVGRDLDEESNFEGEHIGAVQEEGRARTETHEELLLRVQEAERVQEEQEQEKEALTRELMNVRAERMLNSETEPVSAQERAETYEELLRRAEEAARDQEIQAQINEALARELRELKSQHGTGQRGAVRGISEQPSIRSNRTVRERIETSPVGYVSALKRPHAHARDPYARLEELSREEQLQIMKDREEPEDDKVQDSKGLTPDTFHGDPKKVDEFLLQCTISFTLRKSYFRKESKKVLTTIARFRDEAALWIRPYMNLPESAKPAFFNDFELFQQAMKEQWPVEGEEQEARNVVSTLQQTGRVTEYLARYALYAPYTGYDDGALIRSAENGLEISLYHKIKAALDAPKTFDRWRLWVVAHENAQIGANNQMSEHRNNRNAQAGMAQGLNEQRQYRSVRFTPQVIAPAPYRSYSAPVTGRPAVNAPSGPIENYEERRSRGLCFGCGEKGHLGRDCPKRNGAVPNRVEERGRAAYVEDDSDSGNDYATYRSVR